MDPRFSGEFAGTYIYIYIYRIGNDDDDDDDKGETKLNGQTKSSLTTALAPPEMPALISRRAIAPFHSVGHSLTFLATLNFDLQLYFVLS